MLTKTNEKSASNILFINSAQDEARIAIFKDEKNIAEERWEGKELSEKVLEKINQLVVKNKVKIDAIAVYPGPGSYTGLRIGITVANFLSWSLSIPIFEADADGNIRGSNNKMILPKYLRRAHITKPKLRK